MVPAIAVCDGIAMGHIGMKYSLVTRDLIADSTEALAMAHQFDGLVMIPNCDKNVPGLLMAAARVNIPTIFVSGGPMLAGHVKGSKTSLSSMFEAVGSYAAGKFSEEDVCEFEEKACPTCGSCSGMYTANSMNCLTEALGGTERKRNHSGSVFCKTAACKTCGNAGDGAGKKEYPPKRHYDKRSDFKCIDSGHGTGMFHKQYAAHSCDCT